MAGIVPGFGPLRGADLDRTERLEPAAQDLARLAQSLHREPPASRIGLGLEHHAPA